MISSSEYPIWYRTPECYKRTQPAQHLNPFQSYFCKKWGDQNTCPELCPKPPPNKCFDVQTAMKGLDFFSAPPLHNRKLGVPEFRYKKNSGVNLTGNYDSSEMFRDTSMCCGKDLDVSANNPNYVDNSPMISYDLPFVMYPMFDTSIPAKPKHKYTLAQRCLYPSEMRYLGSVYNDEHVDFYKLRTREDISLYRTRLAIDTQRPKPKICPEENAGTILDTTKPIYVNARVIEQRKPKKNQTSYTVTIPGPICLG